MGIVRLPVLAVTLIVCAVLVGAATIPQVSQAQGVPGTDPNKCLAGKTKCVNKKIAGLLKCRTKCQQSPTKCGQAQTDCETKVMDKFDGGPTPANGCFAKLEAKEDPMKPDSVCTTTGDTASVEAQVDDLAGEVVATLEGMPPSTPTCADLGLVTGFCSPPSGVPGGGCYSHFPGTCPPPCLGPCFILCCVPP
jgi:hypothetical protein